LILKVVVGERKRIDPSREELDHHERKRVEVLSSGRPGIWPRKREMHFKKFRGGGGAENPPS